MRVTRERGVRRRRARALATRGRSALARRKIDSRAARLREANRDRLLGRARPVLAFADVVNFLADELARLRGRALSLGLVAPRAPYRFFGGHAARACITRST